MAKTENNSIALYLGESFASLKVFNSNQVLLSKDVFLPQVNLRNLLQSVKKTLSTDHSESFSVQNAYIVTKYFDRLKHFRLGGSIVQVVAQGFENSYQVANTASLSLAAPALMISLSSDFSEEQLASEFTRTKKVNPEANKVVFILPENYFSTEKINLIQSFFEKENFKIFKCSNPYDFKSLRRTLLNAGSEGTKDEIIEEFQEAFSEDIQVKFWVKDHFSNQFENIDLYISSLFFLDHWRKKHNFEKLYYFDCESWMMLTGNSIDAWASPWGEISLHSGGSIPESQSFSVHPYSELTFNSLGELVTSDHISQMEPGPMIAGRSTRSMVIDLFYKELSAHKNLQSIFPQLQQTSLQQKLSNHFQVLERGQSFSEIAQTQESLKNLIMLKIENWLANSRLSTTPVASVGLDFLFTNTKSLSPKEIKTIDLSDEIIKLVQP